MIGSFPVTKRKIGRPLKNRDEVLGASVSACITKPLYRAIMREADAAGCNRPGFLRLLLKLGLATWQTGQNPTRGTGQLVAALPSHDLTRGQDKTAERGT